MGKGKGKILDSFLSPFPLTFSLLDYSFIQQPTKNTFARSLLLNILISATAASLNVKN